MAKWTAQTLEKITGDAPTHGAQVMRNVLQGKEEVQVLKVSANYIIFEATEEVKEEVVRLFHERGFSLLLSRSDAYGPTISAGEIAAIAGAG